MYRILRSNFHVKNLYPVNSYDKTNMTVMGPPQGFWGAGEKGYLFSGSWGALLIILGELGSKHIILGI